MITDYQRSLLEHSLGGGDPEKWHRNHFMASPGHQDLPDLLKLKEKGLMKQMDPPSFCDGDSLLFVVTKAGKDFLKDDPKRIPKTKESTEETIKEEKKPKQRREDR